MAKRKKMTFARLLKIITAVLTWTCVLFIWIMAMFTVIPRIQGKEPYIVLSGSMEPMIPTGSVVYVKKMQEEPEVGDIVAFVALDDAAVIHRIADYNPETGEYTTKGDANDAEDGTKLTEDRMLGIYDSHVPKVGILLANLDSHVFYVGNIEVPAAIPIMIGGIMLLNLFSFLADKREEKK